MAESVILGAGSLVDGDTSSVSAWSAAMETAALLADAIMDPSLSETVGIAVLYNMRPVFSMPAEDVKTVDGHALTRISPHDTSVSPG